MKYCPECANQLSLRQHEGKQYQSCEQCSFTNWNNPIPVVAAIVELNQQLVLVHNCQWPAKMLGLVSGFLEQNEVPEEAIEREVSEELGLKTDASTLIGVYGFAQQNQVIIAYHLICSGEIVLNEELDAYKLLDPDKLKAWEFGTGPAVKDWLKSRREALSGKSV